MNNIFKMGNHRCPKRLHASLTTYLAKNSLLSYLIHVCKLVFFQRIHAHIIITFCKLFHTFTLTNGAYPILFLILSRY